MAKYTPIIIGDMRFNTIKAAQKYFNLSSPYLIQKGLQDGIYKGMTCQYIPKVKKEINQKPSVMNRIYFKIGNKEYKAIRCAQLEYNLPDAKPIYQALIDGEFRGMPCTITKSCKPMAPDTDTTVIREKRNGIRVRCEETKELYNSMSDLYRIAKEMNCIKVPYQTFAHALRKYGSMKIDGETYTIMDEKRKISKYTRTLKPIEEETKETINEMLQQETRTKEEPRAIPSVSVTSVQSKDILIKKLLTDMVKERLVKHVNANEYSNAKGMLEVIEWINNK